MLTFVWNDDRLGKTPEEVAQVIIDDVGDAKSSGSVVVLVGLSGTGKGTTVRIVLLFATFGPRKTAKQR